MYKRFIDARSGNHPSRGKAISIAYSECASVAFGIKHARCMLHVVICGPSGCPTFFHFI